MKLTSFPELDWSEMVIDDAKSCMRRSIRRRSKAAHPVKLAAVSLAKDADSASFAKDTAAKTKQSARTKAEDGDAIEPTFREWDGTGSLNLHRRHLNESQRGMVAQALATMSEGRHATSSIELVSQTQAAEMLNVSVATVKRAAKVRKEGTPETLAAVESGQLPVSVATQAHALPRAWA